VLGREARLPLKLSRTRLEHFPEKRSPVFRQKMRPLDKTRVLSGSLEPESTLVFLRKDHAPVQGLHLLGLSETLKQLLDFKQDISFVWIGLALGLPASFIGIGNAFRYLQSLVSFRISTIGVSTTT
jgi:hypothetical protein